VRLRLLQQLHEPVPEEVSASLFASRKLTPPTRRLDEFMKIPRASIKWRISLKICKSQI
jgi:hypothetical protein